MNTDTLKPIIMKNILLILLFVSGFASAQLTINTPSPYVTCASSVDSSSIATFDFNTKSSEVLGNLDSFLYSISYFATLADAQSNTNSLPLIFNNANSNVLNTVFIRVWENANANNFSTTTLSLVVNALPTLGIYDNLFVFETPMDNVAQFDLTTRTNLIENFESDRTVTYYPSILDAQNGTNPIVNPTNYTNISNPQTIGFRLFNNINGCYLVNSFKIKVANTASIINIPDANFKNYLLANQTNFNSNFDINQDGNIQTDEALNITELSIAGLNISDLTGIENFINLTTLDASNNQLTNFASTGLSNLKTLDISYNLITTINTSEFTNLTGLNCSNNLISTIETTNLSNLTSFSCSGNNLTGVFIDNMVNLNRFQCSANPIITLNFGAMPNLHFLSYGSPQLINSDVSNLINLTYLAIQGSQQSSINLSNNTILKEFGGYNLNAISTLDLSSTVVEILTLVNCPNLNSIFIKTGKFINPWMNGFIQNLPNLHYVCCDDFNAFYFQFTSSHPTVNSYCSFTPGGNYLTLNGLIKFDSNSNGCDINDLSQSNIRVNAVNSLNSFSNATFSDANGIYNFYNLSTYSNLSLDIENPTWFSIATSPYGNYVNNNSVQDFCITPNGIHNDLEAVIEPISNAIPDTNSTYKLVFRNKGNQTLSGASGLVLNYDSSKMTFVSASQTALTSNAGVLNFGYSLNPFESKSIDLTFHINSPTNSSPTNIDDVLNFTTSIIPAVTDENPNDNTFPYNQTVVGSYDPNSIECLEGPTVDASQIGNYLHYAVNFENTGNSVAENVVVKDVIDIDKYDIESLQVMNTSNPAYIKITGNVVEFIFQNIHLAPRGGNPPVGGHGNVLFKIKSKNNLVPNDFAEKTSKIYFDYNAPIDTNIAQTTFISLSNSIPVFDNSVTIFPNPTIGNVNIKSNFNIKSIELYDIQGRILETSFENGNITKFDISEKQKGIYFLKVNTEKGSKIEKVVKE